VGPAPAASVPSPHPGFVMPDSRTYRGYQPTTHELLAMQEAITNLEAFHDFAEVLGKAAPPATELINALTWAMQWSALRQPAADWDAYVRAQTGMAWKQAVVLLGELKPLFENAIAHDRALAVKYHGLTELFEAPKAVARQSLATRRKNAKAKAAAAESAATSADAKATASEAPVVQGKTVTVTL
jgi:hypothetical protein